MFRCISCFVLFIDLCAALCVTLWQLLYIQICLVSPPSLPFPRASLMSNNPLSWQHLLMWLQVESTWKDVIITMNRYFELADKWVALRVHKVSVHWIKIKDIVKKVCSQVHTWHTWSTAHRWTMNVDWTVHNAPITYFLLVDRYRSTSGRLCFDTFRLKSSAALCNLTFFTFFSKKARHNRGPRTLDICALRFWPQFLANLGTSHSTSLQIENCFKKYLHPNSSSHFPDL